MPEKRGKLPFIPGKKEPVVKPEQGRYDRVPLQLGGAVQA